MTLPPTLDLLRYGAVGLSVLATLLFVYAVASAPSRAMSALGLRGMRRQRALERGGLWTTTEPLVRWLGVRVSPLVGDELRQRIDDKLMQSGDRVGMTSDEFVALSIVSTVVGALIGAVVSVVLELGPVGYVFGPLLGAVAPWLQLSGTADERLREISRGLPQTTDLMAMAMGAGLDFPGAVRQVVDKASNPDDPIVDELGGLLRALSIGRTRRDALGELMTRVPTEVVKEFCSSLIQAEERGNPVAEVLQIQATTARTRRSVRAEELAAKAGVKITIPLMMVFGCVLGLVLGPALLSVIEAGGVQ